jgi:hypothetical protein
VISAHSGREGEAPRTASREGDANSHAHNGRVPQCNQEILLKARNIEHDIRVLVFRTRNARLDSRRRQDEIQPKPIQINDIDKAEIRTLKLRASFTISQNSRIVRIKRSTVSVIILALKRVASAKLLPCCTKPIGPIPIRNEPNTTRSFARHHRSHLNGGAKMEESSLRQSNNLDTPISNSHALPPPPKRADLMSP